LPSKYIGGNSSLELSASLMGRSAVVGAALFGAESRLPAQNAQSVLLGIRSARQMIGENEKARDPQADKNAEPFRMSLVPVLCKKPCQNRCGDGQQPKPQSHIRSLVHLVLGEFEFFEG